MTAPLRLPRVTAAARDFQGALDQLVAEPAPRLLRLWPHLGAGLIAALVTAAALLPIDVVVTAQGKLAADAPPVLLRPLARATLRELLVRPGDVVAAGQVLARLDASLTQSDARALLADRRATEAEIARREAELSGRPVPAAAGVEAAGQADVLATRADMAQARRAALAAAIAALQAEVQIETDLAAPLAERLSIARKVEVLAQDLRTRNLGTEGEALQAAAARAEAEAALGAHDARLADLARRIRATEDELVLLDSDLRREAAEALPALRLHLAQLDDALDKAARLSELADLTAPRPGVVLSVAPGGPGAVVAEGEPVVTLIPTDAALLAEVSLASADMGRVAPGDAVTLKFDAYPWRRIGAGQGRIDSLAPATFTPDGTSAALNPARVTLTAPPPDLPPGAILLPGMTLTAEVHTGTRTVLDFFLDPLMRGLTTSLREP